MKEVFRGIYRVFPTKITPTKYTSFFVVREPGNLLFPCLGSKSTFEDQFTHMQELGGVSFQLLGDMHFATRDNDKIFDFFGTPLICSEVEAPDVTRKVKEVRQIPFERQEICDGVEMLPTPGHRPGAASYLVQQHGKKILFVGDSIWHNGTDWECLVNKRNINVMVQTLEFLKKVDFDAMYANTSVQNSSCSQSFTRKERVELLDHLIQGCLDN